MNSVVKAILIVFVAIVVFAGLIYLKIGLSARAAQKQHELSLKIAPVEELKRSILADSLYTVKDVVYRDSAIVIAVDNPEKSGTESYFDKKYKLNGYDNINMVYIYQADTSKSLRSVSFDDALMATGKKMGKFQQEWVSKFIDTTDGSCKPLKNYVQSSIKIPSSYKNQETVYQPASINKMQVICKYFSRDSLGVSTLHEIAAIIGNDGAVAVTTEKKR